MKTRIEGEAIVVSFEVRLPADEVTTVQAGKRKPKPEAQVRAAMRKALNDLARKV